MKFLFIGLAVILYSCAGSAIKNELKKADEITIHFYSNSQADSVIKIVHTTSTDAIEKLASFIDNEELKTPPCGRDGDIVFTKGDKNLLKVDFKALNVKCRQFEFDYSNRHYITKVSNEAADFLTSLWAGKSYY